MNLDQLRDWAQNAPQMAVLFQNSERFAEFSADFDGILLDYSKTHLTEDTRAGLLDMIAASGLNAARDAMFAGQRINATENRAVLHVALRAQDGAIMVDGRDVLPAVRETRARMGLLADAVRAGHFAGAGGTFTDVVNIGIGGSDLGPVMAVTALAPYHDGPRCHFVSNVDGAHLADVLRGLDPACTLVIIASKTFTTIETMTNAASARAWLAAGGVADPAAQCIALSSATAKAAEFGIPAARVFGFEDWVGGRYSVWGPIGLALMLAIGRARFDEFLAGAASMDAHFRDAPIAQNLPVLLAMVGLWHHQGMRNATRAVIPYDQRLARLPAYLQQLEMESNGKGVRMDGTAVATAVAPVVWGEPGTNGQHAFFQLLHQGAQIVPVEFLIAGQGHEPDMAHHHRLLVANCLAQSQALMQGRTLDAARAMLAGRFAGAELERQARHRVFSGERPSVTLAYDRLTPRRLGQIIALYEHRTFVEGVAMGINSFDQWGVELGKELANALGPVVDGNKGLDGQDASTAGLITHLMR